MLRQMKANAHTTCGNAKKLGPPIWANRQGILLWQNAGRNSIKLAVILKKINNAN